jgi:hypothetical protein
LGEQGSDGGERPETSSRMRSASRRYRFVLRVVERAQIEHAQLSARGSVEAGEGGKMLDQVRGFLEKHGASRFARCVGTKLTDTKLIQHNRAGFLRIEDGEPVGYAVLPNVWKNEVCAGFHTGDVTKELMRLGHLKADKRGNAPSVERLPGMGTTRAYIIRLGIFRDQPVQRREAKAT